MSRIHEVKTIPQFFEPAAAGAKPFTIRINDRNYKVGDTLFKREWDEATGVYTGREAAFEITYITSYGQHPGVVVMGIELQRARDWNKAEGTQYTPEQITELLEEVRTAREAATPGPWIHSPGDHIDEPAAVYILLDELHAQTIADNLLGVDAHYIANSPAWLQQLTEIAQQQAAEIERLNHVLEQIEHDTEDEYTSEYARANRSKETK
ncbi:DUF3850 domain-containing protein [Paenibacillus tyrfis]|uniref:DUF3850 domain-containing protein n=1 Tax=Paenibacillus tyrfis TaxID=1501230 RepID=UPI000B591FC4|nr:DUF3850 domain-containing protein [Paenibacillus tyrfis]